MKHAMRSPVNGSNVARGKGCGQESSPGPSLAPPPLLCTPQYIMQYTACDPDGGMAPMVTVTS